MRQIRIRKSSRRPHRAAFMILAALVLAGIPRAALAAPPGNDEFQSATVITKMPYSDRIDATNATVSPTDPTVTRGSGPSAYQDPLCRYGNTLWYAFTPDSNMRLVADTFDSDFDTYLAAFAGTPSSATLIACNGDWRSPQSRVSFEAKAGQTYYFMASGFGGVLQFNLAPSIPPANNEPARAKTISVNLPYKDRMNTTEATLNVSDPSCSGRARSVWYRLSRPESWRERRIEINTFGSNYDTTLSVYSGPRQALRQLECDDNSRGATSRVRFLAEPGTTYWVMVGASNNSEGGTLVLTAKNMPLPFKMRLQLSSVGRISSVTGATHVGGTFACNKKTEVDIYVELRQQQLNGEVKSVSARKELSCSKSRKWTISMTPDRPFMEGPAGLFVTMDADTHEKEKREKRLIELDRCARCL